MLPHLEQHLAEKVDSVAAYQLLYHEAALANLLEVPALPCLLPAWQSACQCVCQSLPTFLRLSVAIRSAACGLPVALKAHCPWPRFKSLAFPTGACGRCCCSTRMPVRAWERRR